MLNDIVDTGTDTRVYLAKKGGGRLAGDIGGSGDQGFAQPPDQVAAERVVDETDGDGAIGIDEIISKPYRAFIDDSGGFLYRMEKIEYTQIGLAGVFQDIPFVGHQHDKAFGGDPLFQPEYLIDSDGVGRITTNSPYGIGGIENEAPGVQDGETVFYVFFKFHNRPQI